MESFERNQSTHVVSMENIVPSSDAFFRVSFGLAAPQIAEIASTSPSCFIVGVVTPRSGEIDIHHVTPAKERMVALVVGRHECADMVLTTDPTLSLRHALVLLKMVDDGSGLIRILDLRSGTGLRDLKGTRHFSVATNGPVALRAGETALFVLPPNLSIESHPLDNPYRAFDDIPWIEPVQWIPRTDPEKHISGIMAEKREITAVSVVTDAKEVSKERSEAEHLKPAGIIQVKVEDKSYTYDVDTMSLRAGVLVGRYGRCDLNEQSLYLPREVSRVHALFLSMDDRIHVFDVGSTNGLTFEDFPIRNLALPEHQPSTFEIIDDIRISWVPGATVGV